MYLFIYLIVKTLRFVQKSSVTTNPGLRSAASKMFGRVTITYNWSLKCDWIRLSQPREQTWIVTI